MNKQEAIEKIKNIDTLNINDKIAGQQVDMVIKNQVLSLIEQIDEPQKVTIPKFVAEWIGYCKFKGFTLLGALDPVSELSTRTNHARAPASPNRSLADKSPPKSSPQSHLRVGGNLSETLAKTGVTAREKS